MISLDKMFDSRVRSACAAVLLMLVAVMPALVSAAQVTERSIALSSSSAGATGVTYQVNFTAVGGAGAFVVDFCSNSPVIGQSCTAPTGFTAAAAASTTSGFTDVTGGTNKVVVAGTINAEDEVSVALTGITNPAAAGPLYARVVTYDTDAHADAYTSTNLGTGNIDDGGVAISITPTIAVSAAVLETMTFCIAKNTIDENCDLTGNEAPTLRLGETVGDDVVLTTNVSTGQIHTQISTNAATGAIVSLKSNATNCGGLLRAGAPTACDILPALATDIANGEAKFGVKTATATDTGTGATGAFQPYSGSGYNASTFALNFVDGNATGITSTYGDPFLDTNNAPVNNKNMALTFGAAVSNNTPAGLYSADLSLIATGKF